MPQVHILLGLWILNPDLIRENNPALFDATFASSIMSATFGIAKFLKNGPCRLIPNQGFLGGYCQIGFILILLNVNATMLSKGFALPIFGYEFEDKRTAIIIGICVFYVPNMIYVSFTIIL